MTTQIIITPAGDRLVVLPEAEYQALLEAAEDASDVAAVRSYRSRLADGEEERVPSEVVDQLLSGVHPVTVWRQHRKMTSTQLAQAAGISQPFLSQIESGKREGTVGTMKAIAEALRLSIDDLV